MNVWYVSYGSNICEERFLCYINGDIPEGSTKRERGCIDKTPPIETGKAELPYSLFFAKERSKWGEGGVAFIDQERTEDQPTFGRKYLITAEQFYDVVAQENNMHTVEIDLEKVIKEGSLSMADGWYGQIVYLGKENGYPMFTFTLNSKESQNKTTYNRPSITYLSMIIRGLKELGMGKEEVLKYLMDKNGIKEYFTEETLKAYVE
ncbi:hypothetical protein GLV94_04840 [Virgibacillus halodenitrificans]|uniref:hypothetical protein n=1 Tax=Virgibacillus halodenitrificans TaxID=1482 RepID=UPI00136B9475|nr:hypothetical protein [Virgibacillus halodenitrificans]MYL44960.1 hypothetical protein [Virgibacillus halodenitrificans]